MAAKVRGMSKKDSERYLYCSSWHRRPHAGDFYVTIIGGRFHMPPGLRRSKPNNPAWRLMVFHSPAELWLKNGESVAVAAESLVIWREPSGPVDIGHRKHPWLHSWITCAGPRADALIAEAGLPLCTPIPLPSPTIADRTLLGLYHELTIYAQPDQVIQESLIRLLLSEASRARAGDPGRADPDDILWVRRRLDRELDREVPLDALARAAGMSPRHLVRRFLATWGLTPAAYHLRMRMTYAKTLLDQPGVPLAPIARAVGYVDAFAFSKAFKRHTGVSPQDYRGASPARAYSGF